MRRENGRRGGTGKEYPIKPIGGIHFANARRAKDKVTHLALKVAERVASR